MEATAPTRPSGLAPRFWLTSLLLFIFLAQLPPYADAFLLDDYKQLEFIQGFVSRPWRAYRVLSPSWIGWYYRPLQHWLILGNRLLFGSNPLGYYVTSLGLHCLNVVLLYRLGRRLRLAPAASLLAAALFGVHWMHYDVLGWISSVSLVAAATLSLLSLLAFARYLCGGTKWWLAATFAAFLVALLAREESLLLPLVLLAMWHMWHGDGRRRARRGEWLFALITIATMALYLYVQGARPTWTASLDPQIVGRWWQATLSGEPLRFLFRSASLYLVPALPPAWPSPFWQQVAGLALALGGLLWWWRSRWPTRLALLWAAATLAFVFLLVWAVDAPSFAPRYLYLPWLGLSLAAGAALVALGRRLPPAALSWVVAGLCLLFIATQATQLAAAHQNRYTHTRYMHEVRRQLKTMIPQPGPDAHFFAHDFPSVADYVQAMAAVWYEQPLQPPGGSVGRLLEHGRATADFYVLNHEQGRLYNLMPELQQSAETVFAWDQQPLAQRRGDDGQAAPLAQDAYSAGVTAGPPGDRRLALALMASGEGWTSLAYERTVPEDSRLHVAIFMAGDDEAAGAQETQFRLRLQPAQGPPVTLFEARRAPGDFGEKWEEITLPVGDYGGQRVTLLWEAAGTTGAPTPAFWANPRFVLGAAQ